MNLLDVVMAYIRTVDGLMSTRLSGNRVIYIETKEGRYINFVPNTFKRRLKAVVGEGVDVKNVMRHFRSLGWIVVNPAEKFTNIQWIKQKSVRVITVDREKYDTLKELVGDNVGGGGAQ